MNRPERFARRGNMADNPANRPGVEMKSVTLYSGETGVIVTYRRPLFVARVVGGRTIGGGTSKEALQRAKRRARGVHQEPPVGAWMENITVEQWLSKHQPDNNGSSNGRGKH